MFITELPGNVGPAWLGYPSSVSSPLYRYTQSPMALNEFLSFSELANHRTQSFPPLLDIAGERT